MQISVYAELQASPDAVWKLVGDFANLAAWSPAIHGCVMDGEGVGAHRTIRTAAGAVRERLDEWDPQAKRLAYTPVSGSSLPVRGLRATIALSALPSGSTRVEWRIEGEPTQPQAAVEALLQKRYAARLEDLRNALQRTSEAA